MKSFKIRRLTDVNSNDASVRIFVRSHLNQEDTHAELCKVCPKPIWFTAFFDGTGNNYDEDGDNRKRSTNSSIVKYSNISKLAKFAHPSDKECPPRVYSTYMEGVGTPSEKAVDSGLGLDGAAGMAAAAKGQARIDVVFRELEQAVKDTWPFVSQINLAVFGFSRGATQARAFVRQLNGRLAELVGDELLWKIPNVDSKRPKVVVYFMGIMDTVASTGFGGSLGESVAKHAVPAVMMATIPLVGTVLGSVAGGILRGIDQGGHAAWANDLTIPEYVQQCIHYVAGHELREKFPSDSVRRDQDFPSNCVEIVYPGMHSDVGGGYAPSDPAYQEGRGNELSRIPLCHMYIEAYKAGVPFKAPAEVLASAGSLFDISPELERVFEVYMDGAPNGGRLETAIIWHMNRYYEWRESRRRRLKDGRLKPHGGVDRYMAITDAEWESDVLDVAKSQTGYIRSNAYPNEQAIFDAYQYKLMGAMKPDARADFDLFFDRYVHDSIAGFKKQMIDASKSLGLTERSRCSINRKIFMGKRGTKFLYWCYNGWIPEHSGTKVAKRVPVGAASTELTA